MVGLYGSSTPNKTSCGQTYIVFGSSLPNAWGSGLVLDLRTFMNVTQGFALQGPLSYDFSVSTAGDLNGDGLPDVIIGAPSAAGYFGKSYVMLTSKSRSCFTANNIRLTADQVVQLTLKNINISLSINQLRFTVESVDFGYFASANSATPSVTSFSLQDLVAGSVRLVHTGNGVAPQYRLCFIDFGSCFPHCVPLCTNMCCFSTSPSTPYTTQYIHHYTQQ